MKNGDSTREVRAIVQAAGGTVLRTTTKGHLLVAGPGGTATVTCHRINNDRTWINGLKELERIGLRVRTAR